MNRNTNTDTNSFDLSKFEKVEDIIFLDEPILSHYKRNNKDFLWYLVDTVDGSDIYMLLEVDEDSIYEYITGKASLKNVITSNQNIAYIIEQDFNGVVLNVKVTQSDVIDKNYLPDDDSYLTFEPTEESHYFTLIKEYQSKPYLKLLREKAFYLKIAFKSLKYADTIGFNELANTLLSNISSSFKSFLKADFIENFKYSIGDENKLIRIFNKLLPELDFRMVDLKFGSFEIGLSIDNVMKNSIENREMKEWAKTVGNKYQNIVLNKLDDENVDRIVSEYNEEDRKKIFNPIFKITENSDYNLSIKPTSKSSYTLVKARDASIIEKIIPEKLQSAANEGEKDYQIVNVTTIVDKNKSNKSINLEETLFDSSNHANVELKSKDFNKYGYILDFDISVQVEINTRKNLIQLSAKYDDLDFVADISTGKIDDGIQKITSMIYEYILNKDV